MDMHSGGRSKERWEYIYIQAPEAQAKIVFYNRFGHSPDRVSCTCCGQDYSVNESPTLEEVTAYERGCAYENKEWVEHGDEDRSWRPYQTIEQYRASGKHKFITADEITADERTGELPEQGYIWRD